MSITKEALQNLREDYTLAALDEKDVAQDPIQQFERWLSEAVQAEMPEPNAMTLATASPDGFPSARIVLLKGIIEGGFVFYTNFDSEKGQSLRLNPQAALCFCWLDLQRQVRIEGRVEKVEDAVATAYFQSRPKSSQLGAWASPQSTVVSDRQVLDAQYKAMETRFAADEVLPKPPFWGGFRVVPTQIEFWQGRRSRLHDRIQYRKVDGIWVKARLAP